MQCPWIDVEKNSRLHWWSLPTVPMNWKQSLRGELAPSSCADPTIAVWAVYLPRMLRLLRLQQRPAELLHRVGGGGLAGHERRAETGAVRHPAGQAIAKRDEHAHQSLVAVEQHNLSVSIAGRQQRGLRLFRPHLGPALQVAVQ